MKRTVGFIFAVVSVAILSCSKKTQDTPMTFNGASEALQSTEIVLRLDSPLPKGKNAIWCASGQLLLETVKQQLEKGDFGTHTYADFSNNLPAGASSFFPRESLYVAAGMVQNDILDQIRTDLKQRFPGKPPPAFPQLTSNTLVGYSYFESGVRFSKPYRQNSKPFAFTEGSGDEVEVSSFGLPPEDHGRYKEVRAQARILFVKGDAGETNLEFAVDLCSNSSPSQIVVALITPAPSLAAAFANVQKECAAMELSRDDRLPDDLSIWPDDSLLVPDFYWAITHHFSSSEVPKDLKLEEHQLVLAQQEILFRLNRLGAELKSWGIVAYTTGVPRRLLCNRPFLVYMKKRDASEPYFAMWVDNVELMSLWQNQR